MNKTRLDARAPVPRLDEIDKILRELAGGKVEGAKEFLQKEALKEANSRGYKISAKNLKELGDRLAEAETQVEEDIRIAVEKLDEAKEKFKAAKGDIDQRQQTALDVIDAERMVETLRSKQKEDFQYIQRFVNAAEALEK